MAPRKPKNVAFTPRQSRMVYVGMKQYMRDNPEAKQYNWEEVLKRSMLSAGHPEIKSERLRQFYLNMKKSHNVKNLEEFLEWSGNRSSMNSNTNRSEESTDSGFASASCSPPRASYSAPVFPDIVLSTVERKMKRHLEKISEFPEVSRGFLLSVELWRYIGKHRMGYRRFREIASLVVFSSRYHEQPFLIDFKSPSDIETGMRKMKSAFGDKLDPKRVRLYFATENGGASVEDGGASMEDGGASMEDGEASVEVRGPSVEHAGGVVEDAGGVVEDAVGVVEDVLVVNLDDEDETMVVEDGSQGGPNEFTLASPKRLRLDSELSSKRGAHQIPNSSIYPLGYGAMHQWRELTTIEWQRILSDDDGKYNRLGWKTAAGWEKLKTKLKICTTKSGQEIMKNFYCKVAPYIRDKEFEPAGSRVNLELRESNDCAMLAIFYRIEVASDEGVEEAVENLLEMRVLAGDIQNPAGVWSELFKKFLHEKDQDFFVTTKKELMRYRSAISTSNL